MKSTLAVLYIITNLGPSFTFEYNKTIAIFKTEQRCNLVKDDQIIKLNIKPPHRMECKLEDYYYGN